MFLVRLQTFVLAVASGFENRFAVEQAAELAKLHAKIGARAMRSNDAWQHARGAQRKRNGARGTSYGPGGQPGRRGAKQFRSASARWVSPQERYAGEPQFRQDRKHYQAALAAAGEVERAYIARPLHVGDAI